MVSGGSNLLLELLLLHSLVLAILDEKSVEVKLEISFSHVEKRVKFLDYLFRHCSDLIAYILPIFVCHL